MCTNFSIFTWKIESSFLANAREELPHLLLNLMLSRIQVEIQSSGNGRLSLYESIRSLFNSRGWWRRWHEEDPIMHEKCWIYGLRNWIGGRCSCGNIEPG